MRELAQTVVTLAAVAILGGSCNRVARVCPEGMVAQPERSTPGKALWCKSADGKRFRWIEFYSFTDRRQSCGYSSGKPEGSFVAWHAGGKPWLEGQYRNGLKVGRWVQWDKTGSKVAEGEYSSGQLVGGAPVGMVAHCEKMKP